MKKIFLLIILVLCLGLTFACEEETPDPDNGGGGDGGGEVITPDDEIAPSKVKELLNAVVNQYKDSLTGSVQILLTNGKNTNEIKLDYNLASASKITEFGYHSITKVYNDVNGTEKEYVNEEYAYVKNNTIYQLANGVEIEEPTDSDVTNKLLSNCGINALIDICLKYYNENEFYNALKYVSKSEDNIYQYALDLIAYQGEKINVANVKTITFNVKIVEEKVVFAELVLNSTDKVNKVYIEFKGLTAPTISFPNIVK